MSEYFRRSIKERSAEGKARAIARGRRRGHASPLGYVRRDDGTLEPDTETIPVARHVFEMRAAGESTSRIRNMLKEHGIDRSHRGVRVMLANRVHLGKIHFGKLVNLHAHEPMFNRELFGRVQRMIIPRGPRPSSDRLLARLGVLRGSCGARLGAMKLPKQDDYSIYRCPSTSDCARRVTISAVIAEEVVISAVRAALADVEGRASMAQEPREAAADLARAQDALDAGVRSFAAARLGDEPAAVERLAELRRARDDAQTVVGDLKSPLATSA